MIVAKRYFLNKTSEKIFLHIENTDVVKSNKRLKYVVFIAKFVVDVLMMPRIEMN